MEIEIKLFETKESTNQRKAKQPIVDRTFKISCNYDDSLWKLSLKGTSKSVSTVDLKTGIKLLIEGEL